MIGTGRVLGTSILRYVEVLPVTRVSQTQFRKSKNCGRHLCSPNFLSNGTLQKRARRNTRVRLGHMKNALVGGGGGLLLQCMQHPRVNSSYDQVIPYEVLTRGRCIHYNNLTPTSTFFI